MTYSSLLKVFFLILFSISLQVSAQKYTLDNETSFLQVLGTSTLHDWHVHAEKQSGSLVFKDVANAEVSSISFSVESTSLKSGKSGMDKKTFKALKTNQFSSIDFVFTELNAVTKKTTDVFDLDVQGKLTICGVTKPVTLSLEITFKDTVIIVSGSYKLLMTSFGIQPPKALLGTIKTGDEIEIKFKSVFIN